MAITPEIPKAQPDVPAEQAELTPRAEIPQPSQELQPYVQPVASDQAQTIIDDQGNAILQPTFTVTVSKEDRNAPVSEARRWHAVFIERVQKMVVLAKKLGVQILFPTKGWSQHPSQQGV